MRERVCCVWYQFRGTRQLMSSSGRVPTWCETRPRVNRSLIITTDPLFDIKYPNICFFTFGFRARMSPAGQNAPYFLWDVITIHASPQRPFSQTVAKVWEWVSNYIPLFDIDVIIYPWHKLNANNKSMGSIFISENITKSRKVTMVVIPSNQLIKYK